MGLAQFCHHKQHCATHVPDDSLRPSIECRQVAGQHHVVKGLMSCNMLQGAAVAAAPANAKACIL